jgi:hypothetical protein
MADDALAEALLGTLGASGALTPLMWMDPVTENPAVGAVEIRELYNTTGDAHPMHVHEVKSQLVDRQPIAVDEAERTIEVYGPVRGPDPWESGFKDTVVVYPGEVTRIRVQFVNPGQFVWHCWQPKTDAHLLHRRHSEALLEKIGAVLPASNPFAPGARSALTGSRVHGAARAGVLLQGLSAGNRVSGEPAMSSGPANSRYPRRPVAGPDACRVVRAAFLSGTSRISRLLWALACAPSRPPSASLSQPYWAAAVTSHWRPPATVRALGHPPQSKPGTAA